MSLKTKAKTSATITITITLILFSFNAWEDYKVRYKDSIRSIEIENVERFINAEHRFEKGEGWNMARYIGRYVKHPPIAESRIISFDGKQVTFWYRD